MVTRYKLAEKISERLDEMGKDLGEMIEEINSASSALNKNSRSDDPVSIMTICALEMWLIKTVI